MQLIVFERHELRIVAAELVVRRTMARLTPEPPAVARVVAYSMTAGTRLRSEAEIFQTMRLNMIQLRPRSGGTWFGVSLRSMSSGFDQALALLRDVVLEPTFEPAAVEVVRHRLIAQEAAWADQPWQTAQRNLFAALYGFDHRYTIALASPVHDLERLRSEAVAQAWRKMMDPGETTLIVAGDVNPLVVRQSVGTLFASWKHDPVLLPAHVPNAERKPAAGSPRILAVDRPGARQANLLYGARLSNDSMAQDASRALLDQIVEQAESAAGGEPGATWRASHTFPEEAFWWEKSVAPDQVLPSVRELDGCLGQLRVRGPDAKEFKMACARVTRPMLRTFETVEDVAEHYANLVAADLPVDWFDKFVATVEGLPWEQTRRALPQPDQMRLVVVGDLGALIGPLLSLGWGPVEIHDADGRLLRTVSH